METTDGSAPCSTCGEVKRILRDGFFYCFECNTRDLTSQQTQHDEDIFLGGRLQKKSVKANVAGKEFGRNWSTVHLYNYVLVGLSRELGMCSGSELELKQIVFKLWASYLKRNKMAFFTFSSKPKLPLLQPGFHKKDLQYFYDVKPPTKTAAPRAATTAGPVTKAKLKFKSTTVMRKHFERTITDRSSSERASQTLEGLRLKRSAADNMVHVNKNTINLLRNPMGPEELTKHLQTCFCNSKCKCLLQYKYRNYKYSTRKLSLLSLYAIAILGLRITDNEIQIGDLIRWCREGHVAYSNFDHFLPEDIVVKWGDPQINVLKLGLNHRLMRYCAGRIAKQLRIGAVPVPDIESLVRRYVRELELPSGLMRHMRTLLDKTKMSLHCNLSDNPRVPNFEAIAMAHIIVALKMLFGLDDVTENRISVDSQKINDILGLTKAVKKSDDEDETSVPENKQKTLFVWNSWVRYIEYRKVWLSEYHYPTRMHHYPDDTERPDLFLHHKTTTRKSEEQAEMKRKEYPPIKDVLDNIEFEYDRRVEKFPVFPCSLCPMSSYVKDLLRWKKNDTQEFDRSVLEEDFSSYAISHLWNPSRLKILLFQNNVNLTLKPFREANTKILEDSHVGYDNKIQMNKINLDVEVTNCNRLEWSQAIVSDRITEMMNLKKAKVDLNKRLMEKQKTIVGSKIDQTVMPKRKLAAERKLKRSKEQLVEPNKFKSLCLNVCQNDYWIRRYTKIAVLSNTQMFQEELDKFPSSFVWLLGECAKVIETTVHDLYVEVMDLEEHFEEVKSKKKH